MPASICAWREGIWPWPACSTWPITTCWTWSGSTPARSRAALIAIPPELRGLERGEAAAELADGGAGGAEDHGVGHGASTLVLRPPHGRPRHHRRPAAATGADTIASASSRARASPTTSPDGALGALLERGEARTGFRKLALTHADGRRWLLAGLGNARGVRPRARQDRRRRRARPRPRAGRALAVLGAAAQRLRRRTPPRSSRARIMGALRVHAVQVRRRRGRRQRELDELIVSAHHDVSDAVERGRVVGESVNLRARPPEPPGQRPHADARWPSAPREIAELPRRAHVEVMGRERDRGGRDGRVRRRRPGQPTRSRS